MDALYFVKLGGSLITEKHRASTPRLDVIRRLASEIAQARVENPALRLVLGHGSGSFGHFAAKKHNTHLGVATPEQWRGFSEVWWQARALNTLVVEALLQAGLPVIAFPPSSTILCQNRRVVRWEIEPLQRAIGAGLIPVIYGDVVFDTKLGGTILSTERLFIELIPHLKPSRLLLCGQEEGVWADFPLRQQLISYLTPDNLAEVLPALAGSEAPDVTGGMLAKVHLMLQVVRQYPDLEAVIFSGEQPNSLEQALHGYPIGTRITR